MKYLFALGMGFACVLSTPSWVGAVQSAPIEEGSDVKWSQVVEDAFDGTVVYDKHYTNNFTFVSSWSKQGIRATYTQKDTVLTGYRTTWELQWTSDRSCDDDDYDRHQDHDHDRHQDHDHDRHQDHDHDRHRDHGCKPHQRLESHPTQEPVYETFRTDRIPRKILLAINGQLYTYESGAVSAELAAALSQAPNENMRIRLEWDNGETTDMAIGQGTVKAWKTIFKRHD